jgi:hypothetical protein
VFGTEKWVLRHFCCDPSPWRPSGARGAIWRVPERRVDLQNRSLVFPEADRVNGHTADGTSSSKSAGEPPYGRNQIVGPHCALQLEFAETAGSSFKFLAANLTCKLGGAGFPRGRVGAFGMGQRMTIGMPVPLQETLRCSTRFLTATANVRSVPDRNPKLQFWLCLPLASGEPPSGDDDALLQGSIAIHRKEPLQSTRTAAVNRRATRRSTRSPPLKRSRSVAITLQG